LIPNISVMAVLNMNCLLLAFFTMNHRYRTASLNQNRLFLSTPFVIPDVSRGARKLLDSLTLMQ
jgi:hypothetical protein